MDVFECIETRRCIRKYLNRPVEFSKVIAILEAGHYAPSAGNLQDWRFIIITDRDVIKRLPQHCVGQNHVVAPVVIVVCADCDITGKHYGLRGKRLYCTQNCAAAIENMLLTAHALGLGGNWIGAFDEDKIKEIFSIPEEVRPQAILTFGYPDEEPPPKKVRDLEIVCFFNQYGNKVENMETAIHDYSLELQKKIKNFQERAPDVIDRLGEKLKGIKKEIKERKH
jgi:nitroreductase